MAQIAILVVYGFVLWFAAALLVRTIGPMGLLEGSWGILIFLLVIPVTATALLLDGVAHAWFPRIYGTDLELIVQGAAAIFWGAGVGLFLAFIMNKVRLA
jgi:hypothetical protein